MVIGSLTQTMNESMENYIDSIYLEPDDMVCILGETALHHTLEEHDVSYLWEFACLNEDTNKYIHNAGVHLARKHIDAYHNINTDDENSFNANKKTLMDNIDDDVRFLSLTVNKDGTNPEKSLTDNLKSFKERIEKEEFPKSWLAKKIAWFRSLYAKFMHKNTAARQSGIGGTFKWILASIAKIIDTLLRKLQNAVN